ncbi:MAG: lysophospholipid acyltransferase family protein [Chloroflexi bacterium]|nr:lysophospholipid acyltransferase family protein [Chloroflexota bacterium]
MVMSQWIERTLYGVSKPVVRTYTGTMLKMDVHQKTPFPAGAKIIAPNHPSTGDPFFLASMLGQQSFIMINDVLFHVPILGEYLRRSGHISVKPGHGQEAIDQAVWHLKAGHTIMIFPEGLISPLLGGFNNARTGVARLAIASGAPVFPVGIHIQKNRIRSMKSTVSGKEEIGQWYLQGPYNITVGKPLRFTGDLEDRDFIKDVARQVMIKIKRLAYESEQRWYRINGGLPGTFEAV